MKLIKREEAVQQAKDLKIMQTLCEYCIFGQHLDNSNKNLDEYCESGMLTRFNENGLEILNVESREEEGKNFKAINEKICTLMRTDFWVESNKIREGDAFLEKSKDKLISIAREEVVPSFTYVIYMPYMTSEERSNENLDKAIEKLDKLIDVACSKNRKPSNLLVINNTRTLPSRVISYMREKDPELVWNVSYITSEEVSENSEKSFFRCLDMSFKHVLTNFFYVIDLNDSCTDVDLITYADKVINEDMGRICIIEDKEKYPSNTVFNTMTYKSLGGQGESSFRAKVKELSEEQKCKEVMIDIKTIE